MSVSTVPSQTPNCDRSFFETVKENLSDPSRWVFLVPTIGAIAIGIIFAPNFAIGIAAGAGIAAAAIVINQGLTAAGLMQKEEGISEHAKIILDNPWLATLVAPVAEEGIFRGLIQPLAARCILWAIPAAGMALLGPGISIAVTVSVVATAALFGLVHALNPHKNAKIQAVVLTLSGIAFGLIAAQFGLPAAIAAHIANNTLAVSIAKLIKPESREVPQAAVVPQNTPLVSGIRA